MKQFFEDVEANDGKYSEMETEPVSAVENSNSNSLPSTWRGFGDDENEPTSFVPLKWEVFQIVKYWSTKVARYYWECFVWGSSDNDMKRNRPYVYSRIKLAAAAIGQEAVDQATREAGEEFKRQHDEWLWAIYKHGSDRQWEEVQEEALCGKYKHYCAADLKQMEELETKYPTDLIALVLCDIRAEERSTVLGFSTADSELVPLLEAYPQFEVLTTKSRIRRVTANRTLRFRGFIRARRRGRDWLFDFPSSTPGTVAHSFLESVRNQIKKVLSDAREEDPFQYS